MRPRPLVTTGVVSMFAGELFFIHPNLESHAVSWVLMFVLWPAYGIGAAFLGDRAYNAWERSSSGGWGRLVKLTLINAIIFAVTFLFFKMVFLVAGFF